MALSFLSLFVFFLLHLAPTLGGYNDTNYLDPIDGLDYAYYRRTCPNMEAIIQNKIKHWIEKDPSLAPGLLRLHFHDCAVRGCDGSILLNNPGNEKFAKASQTLRGFDVIDDIKAELEKKCPKTVSCADILTAAARDATHKIGGPYWQLKYGRKDGRTSLAQEAEYMPAGHESTTNLIELFQSKGLTVLDMVVLLGAHTIGKCNCGTIQWRLFNFTADGKPDPSINRQYLNFLTRKCGRSTEYTDLDAITPMTFDREYYKNILKGMGLLTTDQMLYTDSRSGPIVRALALQENLFYQQFGVSMVKLSRTQVLTGNDGEVRIKCSTVN